MSREHKQKFKHSRATDQPTARLDGSTRKKGETKPRGPNSPLGIISLPHRPSSHGARGTKPNSPRLQNLASALLLRAGTSSKEGSTSCVLEHLPNSLAGSSRALEILLGADLLSNSHTLGTSRSESYFGSSSSIAYLLRCHWPLVRLPELIYHPWITSEILLTGDQDYRKARAKMHNLRDPLHDSVSLKVCLVKHAIRTFS